MEPLLSAEDGPRIYARGYHAGAGGAEKSENPHTADSAESMLWERGRDIGEQEKRDLDDRQDVHGLVALFDPRD